jgi:hypothetical protein
VHIIERVNFLLYIVPICSVGVEHLSPRRRSFELRLLSFVVVVVVLIVMVDLMIHVIDGVGERIQILLLMFLRHKRVVLLLLKSHLDWYTTTVKKCLSVQKSDRQ